MAASKDAVKDALDQVSEAASALGCHGYEGYTVETSALDVVFLRALMGLRTALGGSDRCGFYDPEGDIYDALPSSDLF